MNMTVALQDQEPPQTSLDGFAKTGREVEEGGGDVGPAHASLL